MDVAGDGNEKDVSTFPKRVQDRPSDATYDLREDEGKRQHPLAKPNHAIERHVGLGEEGLLERLSKAQKKLRLEVDRFKKLIVNSRDERRKRRPKRPQKKRLWRRRTKIDAMRGITNYETENPLKILRRIQSETYKFTTYKDIDEANRFVRAAIQIRGNLVNKLIKGELDRDELKFQVRFEEPTGFGIRAIGLGKHTEYVTYGVEVRMYRGLNSKRGYRVITTFPVK